MYRFYIFGHDVVFVEDKEKGTFELYIDDKSKPEGTYDNMREGIADAERIIYDMEAGLGAD